MASKSSAARVAAVAGLVVAVAVAGVGAPLGRVGVEVVWFLAIFVVVIPVHELGHALAGALVGFQIRSVIVGVGPPLLTFQVAGVAVRVNVLPLAGATMGNPRRKRWVRLRMWIFAAGGPGANLIVYLILHRFYAHGATPGLGPESFASVAAAANWAVLTLNVIPFRTAEGASSDGYLLLTVPFWGRRQIEDAQVAAEGSALTDALRRNDLEAAAPLAAELRVRHPDHPLSALWSGGLLHRQGRHQEARAVWREALTRETDPGRIAIVKNDIAFVDALIGDAEGLREADALSEAALAARPDHPSIAGTRGAVLVRMGRPAEALPLLRRAAAAHSQDGRGQAYNRASLASALAMLGRPDEARRELERARGANPACELLVQSEADLRSAEARGTASALLSPAEPIARVLGRWGGLVRWQQVARGLAFVYLVAPPNVVSTETFPLLIAALAILLSPEPTGLAVLGACSTWMAVLRALGRAGFGSGDPAPGWQVGLALAFGLGAVALAAIRRHLGPRGPSKAPVLLGCLLGFVALPTFLSVAMKLLHLQSVLRSHLSGVLAQLGPSLSETLTLVGLATVWVVGRRRSVRLLALIPAGLIIAAVMGARNLHTAQAGAEALIRNIPVDGAAIVWSDPRPATVLRTRRVSAAGYRPTLSPGGRAFFVPDLSVSLGKMPRSTISAGDFEGHLVELEGTAAAFVDDERLIIVRAGRIPGSSLEVAEVRPSRGPEPLWSRSVPDLETSGFGVEIDIDPDRGLIVLTGFDRNGSRVIVRTGLERDAPLGITHLASRSPEGDFLLRPFSAPGGLDGLLVSRVRISAGASNATVAYLSADDREGGETDLELWSLLPKSENLVAAHAPSLICPRTNLGRSVIWCVTEGESARTLLKIDPLAGRMTRIAEPIPQDARISSLGSSRFSLTSNGRLGVVDLATGRGDWLILSPSASPDGLAPQLANGALATFSRPARNEDATLTVYALP